MTFFILLAIFLVAVVFQGLYAGYETGFISVNHVWVRKRAEEEDQPAVRALLHLLERPDHTLTMLLVGTNISVVVATMAAVQQVGNEMLAMLIVSPIILVFGEIIPKTVFSKHATRLSLVFLPAIRISHIVLWPVVAPTTFLMRAFLRAVGVKERPRNPFMVSADDMRVLVDESAARGAIEREEQAMIHSIINLDTKRAKELMVPRIDMKALPAVASREELIALFEESGCTRIPIYGDNIDEIVGVINAFDVLTDAEPQNPAIDRFFVRDVLHVPDTIKADDLLKRLRTEKQHLAIVTDEYGGTDGLITTEDIIEEIFGEILDEYDEEELPIQKVGPGAYLVDARMTLDAASEELPVPLVDDDVETVGGWVTHLAERIPARGEVFNRGSFKVTVLEANRTSVSRVRLEILGLEPDEEEAS